jgi:hypothetical protein
MDRHPTRECRENCSSRVTTADFPARREQGYHFYFVAAAKAAAKNCRTRSESSQLRWSSSRSGLERMVELSLRTEEQLLSARKNRNAIHGRERAQIPEDLAADINGVRFVDWPAFCVTAKAGMPRRYPARQRPMGDPRSRASNLRQSLKREDGRQSIQFRGR